MKIPLTRPGHWLPLLILTLVLSRGFFGDIASHEVHGDENWYPATAGTYFTLFALQRDLDSRAWFRPAAWNQPMIGKYLMGGAIWLEGGDARVQRMASLPRWDWSQSQSWNLQNGRRPDSEILIPLRTLMASFGLLACLCLYVLGSRVANRWVGFVAALLLGLNPLTLHCSRFAMLDAPLLFFMIAMPILVLVVLRAYRRGSLRRAIAAALSVGVVGALATGTKLNGAVSLVVFGVVLLALAVEAVLEGIRNPETSQLPARLSRLAALLVAGAATSISLFVLSQPNFYSDPLEATGEMLWNRKYSNLNMQQTQPQLALLDTLPKSSSAVFRKALLPGGYTLFPTLPIPVELVLFSLGLLLLGRSEWEKWRMNRQLGEVTVALIWLFVTFAAITLWIPFEWDRYFLPLLPPTCLFVASGVCLPFARWLPKER